MHKIEEIEEIVNNIASFGGSLFRVPANKRQWLIQGGIAALRGLTGVHFFASGNALKGRGGELRLVVASGTGPILKLLMLREPVLSFGRVSEGHNPLASFFLRAGLEPSNVCNAVVSLNGGLVVFGRFAGRPATVHFPTSKSSHDHMMRHQHGLASARSELADSHLAKLLPELLAVSETHLTQSMMEGEFIDPACLSESQLTAAITAGLDIATVLHRIGQERRENTHACLVPVELDAVSATVGQQGKAFIEAARSAVECRTRQCGLWSVPMHGDLWLGNLCFNERLSSVTGVIDWEWYDGHGLPLLDAIHLIIMSVAMHRRVPVSTLLPEIWHDQDEYLRMLFDRACSFFGVERAAFQWMGIVLWLNLIARGAIEPRPTPFDAWLSAIVLAPGAAASEWLASQHA